MGDHMTDDVLINVSEVGLSEFLTEEDEGSLVLAVKRILTTRDEDIPQYGFSNSI